ncbi:hypothetical protein Pcinc_031938 [Petrolisthes cinctipes]|uniref:Uncharacterized protein n=1 Tax=Petrolisthes cinctipes TaxID=88211 RepID=A0AAE1EVC5_PETCI|nr:hypothetical protein Pcinc_031938 [Petrolisthes cinctipes]
MAFILVVGLLVFQVPVIAFTLGVDPTKSYYSLTLERGCLRTGVIEKIIQVERQPVSLDPGCLFCYSINTSFNLGH